MRMCSDFTFVQYINFKLHNIRDIKTKGKWQKCTSTEIKISILAIGK